MGFDNSHSSTTVLLKVIPTSRPVCIVYNLTEWVVWGNAGHLDVMVFIGKLKCANVFNAKTGTFKLFHMSKCIRNTANVWYKVGKFKLQELPQY